MKHTEENGVHVIKADCQCSACKGTGLYVGMGEHDGMAVQCYKCGGSGKAKIQIQWTDFTGRKSPQRKVVRVLQTNPGISVGAGKDGGVRFGGILYQDWLDNGIFPQGSEMRQFCCPCHWYQLVDSNKKPHWDECGFGQFSQCKHFEDKAECWARWDREFGEKDNDQKYLR